MTCAVIDLPHEGNLSVTLLGVILIDTDSINPQPIACPLIPECNVYPVLRTNMLEGGRKIRSCLDSLMVDDDISRDFGIAPNV